VVGDWVKRAKGEPKAEGLEGELIVLPDPVEDFFNEPKFSPEGLVLNNIPFDNAQKLLSLRAWNKREGVPTLRRWQKSFWSWRDCHWREIDDDTIRSAMWKHLNVAQRLKTSGNLDRFEPKVTDINAILDALAGLVNVESKENPMPGWFGDGRPEGDLRELVALQNGLLHMGSRKLYPHSPRFWSPNILPYCYDPRAKAERFEQFLREIFPRDEEALACLIDMIGLLATDITEYQKGFIFVGPKRGGRGTIGRLLKGLIGPENYAGGSMKAFSEQFGMEDFVGKKIVVFSDARTDGIYPAKMTTIVERLLQITGEDDVPVNRKYLKYWVGKLIARIVIFANEAPKFHDDSGALAGRFLTFEMNESFFGREDPNLTAKLLAERPGILNLALDGLARLRRRGRLIQCASGVNLSERIGNLSSDVGLFVKERCIIGPEAEVLVDTLFRKFQDWCIARGVRYSLASQHFSAKVRAAVPTVRDGRPRDNPSRLTLLTGIGLRPMLWEEIAERGEVEGGSGVEGR
jgi:putative DNA primase/helicase